MQTIKVETNSPYQIFLGEHLLTTTAELLSHIDGYQRVAIVSDANVAPRYLQTVMDSFPSTITVTSIVFAPGEGTKHTTQLIKLVDFFAQQGLTRRDLVIALGGGVIGDLTGFASSVYLRGIRYVQIPTTLLAQVDSSVGGKTAVNIKAGKNLMGTFYQPSAVICDTTTLSTLSEQTFCDGVAEVIKYACIWDADLFDCIEKIHQPAMLQEIIKKCIQIKATIVGKDETEHNLRMILNFGHTIGHAIESYYHYSLYTHGQAVAIGMAQMCAIGEHLSITQAGTTAKLLNLLHQFQLPYRCDLSSSLLAKLCALDKKNHANALHVILIQQIGKSLIHKIPMEQCPSFFSTPTTLSSCPVVCSPGKLSGRVQVPISKSFLHRALIAAFLTPGISIIKGIYLSDDILTTIDCLRRLGGLFDIQHDTITVQGFEESRRPSSCVLFCQESGSTIRFLIPVVAALGIDATFTGCGRLITRPLDIYQQLLPQHGVSVSYDGSLPLSVSGQLQPGDYSLRGDISSQFISGLLFSLPRLHGDSTITIFPPFESKSYVDITCHVLNSFGVQILQQTTNTYFIKGDQQYTPCNYITELDYSQAAFFLVANALGSTIQLEHLTHPSVQGDARIVDLLVQSKNSVPSHDEKFSRQSLIPKAFHISAAHIPDLVPILCVFASQCDGESTIADTQRLRLKESDRISSTQSLLHQLGGKMWEQDGVITIPGNQQLHGGEVHSFGDHRIAMCAAIASTVSSHPIIIHGAEHVKKSYPTFFEDYQRLGGQLHVINLV